MHSRAHIGPSIVIKGNISAAEPLSIAGQVDGTITASGQVVTVEAGATIKGDVAAAGIVVAGTVKGALAADERIHVRAGGQIEGNMAAPRIAFEDGAVARGKVHAAGQDRVTMVA